LTELKTKVCNFIKSRWFIVAAIGLFVALTMGPACGVLATGIGALAAWHFFPVSSPIGVTYAITNQQGVTSFLMGTCHSVDKESFNNKEIKKIIEKCSCLYTETGKHLLDLWSDYDWSNHALDHIVLPYSYDHAITIAAKKQKIPIKALDEGIPSCDKKFQQLAMVIAKYGKNHIRNAFMDNRGKNEGKTAKIKIFEAWKKGNIPLFQYCRKERLSQCTEREAHWVKTLIPHLKTTQKPIVVAVGVTHVVGEDGLSETLKKAGFDVRLITPNVL
jgi:uncharacterized protein YbaP (TraB family)